MSIVVKKIGSKKYAYSGFRHGEKVVHKYMGLVSEKQCTTVNAYLHNVQSF